MRMLGEYGPVEMFIIVDRSNRLVLTLPDQHCDKLIRVLTIMMKIAFEIFVGKKKNTCNRF